MNRSRTSYPTYSCPRSCCNRPEGPPSGIETKIDTAYRLGSCNLCYPENVDEIYSPRWMDRKVIQVNAEKGNGLQFRLCGGHIAAIQAAFNRGRLP